MSESLNRATCGKAATRNILGKLKRSKDACRRTRERADRWPSSPMWEGYHPNPAVRRWHRLFMRYQKEAKEKALARLFEAVGVLAERSAAHVAALYLVHRKNAMKAVALHNVEPANKAHVPFGDRSIVGFVAREKRVEYYQPNVHAPDEKYYREDNLYTQSQVSFAIIWNDELLGVLSLESRFLDGFSHHERLRIQPQLRSLIKDLLVLRSLERRTADWCPWNPDVHGWDAREVFAALCREGALAISPSGLKFTIWNLDWEKNVLSAVGTYGYDWQCLRDTSLPLRESAIGRASQQPGEEIRELDMNTFLLKDKASRLGITKAWMVPVRDPNLPDGLPAAAMTCYSSHEAECDDAVAENDHLLACEALKEFGRMLSKFWFSRKTMKRNLASAVIADAIEQYEDCNPFSQADEWLARMRAVFSTSVGSVFYDRGAYLGCVATTGFRDPKLLIRVGSFIDHRYHKNLDRLSHTVQCFQMEGKSFRRNRVGDDTERGLPFEIVPKASLSHAEFVSIEQFSEAKPENRRFLGCGFRQQGAIAGVVRLVRDSLSPPFSADDADLMEFLCEKYGMSASGFPEAIRVAKKDVLISTDNILSGC